MTNLNAEMYMQRISVRNALLNSIAAAAVQLTPIISTAILTMPMILAVSCSKSALSVRL